VRGIEKFLNFPAFDLPISKAITINFNPIGLSVLKNVHHHCSNVPIAPHPWIWGEKITQVILTKSIRVPIWALFVTV